MTDDIYDIEKKWLRVVSEDFFGPCVRSPNGAFVLAWQNTLRRATGNAARPGRFLLVQGQKILVRGVVRQALSGCVSDTGTFLIACGPRRHVDLESTLYAVRPDGSVLLKHRIKALAGPSAISADGSLAALQATDGDDSQDRGRLLLLDLRRRRLVWKKEPEAGWANRLAIDPARRAVLLGYGRDGSGPALLYGFDGNRLEAGLEPSGLTDPAARQVVETKPDRAPAPAPAGASANAPHIK